MLTSSRHPHSLNALRSAAFLALLILATLLTAPAQTYSVINTFPGGTSGAFPFGTISRDKKDTIYGTTYATDGASGGTGAGVVYSISPTGVETVLHKFAGAPNDGASPKGGLIHSNSILYGATTNGGSGTKCTGGCGIVYTLTLGGKETILHNFAGGTDGANPLGTLILDPSNDVYGTTEYGGSTACPQGCGIVYEVTTGGKEIIGHKFSGPDGKFPLAGLYLSGSVGYGTTSQGGAFGFGTVYKIDTTGKLTTVYSFKGGDGRRWAGNQCFRTQAAISTARLTTVAAARLARAVAGHCSRSTRPGRKPFFTALPVGQTAQIRAELSLWICREIFLA